MSKDYIAGLGKHFGFETKFDGIGITDYRKMTREHYKIQMKGQGHQEQ